MTIDQTLELMSNLQYPRQVDVTDRVMEKIANLTLAERPKSRPLWRRITTVAVAAVALLFVVNLAFPYFKSYDEASIGQMISQVNDYSAWNTVEQAAENPYEYLYEE